MLRNVPFTSQLRAHWQDERSKIFVAIAAGWFLSIGIRFSYPVLLPFFRADYGLSLTAAGLLLTVLWMSYAVGQVPGGVLADRIGEGRTMVISMGIATGTLTLVVLARSPLVLFVGTAALGFAIALFGVVRLTALADIYPERVGTVHGFLGSTGDIGNTILPPIVALVAAVTIWQLGLGVLLPLFVLVAIALWVWVPLRTSPPPDSDSLVSTDHIRSLLSQLSTPAVILVTSILFTHGMIIQAFTGFYPTYLIEMKSISPVIASGLFALFFALGAVIRPVAGHAYDSIGPRGSLLLVTATSGGALALLPALESAWLFIPVTLLLATMLGRGTIAMAAITIALQGDVQNTGLGILRTILFTIGAISPFAFGAFADRGYFDEGFLFLALLSGVAIVIILFLPSVEEQ